MYPAYVNMHIYPTCVTYEKLMSRLSNTMSNNTPPMHHADTCMQGKNTPLFQQEVALQANCHTTNADIYLVSVTTV